MVRWGGGSLFEQQLSTLVSAGIDDIVLLTRSLTPAMQAIVNDWHERGATIEAAPNADAVLHGTESGSQLLILAENLVTTSATLAHVAENTDPVLFVREAATSDDRHERIDLNDRWAGLAVIPAEFLANLPELEADWSLQSALLRHAVQQNVRRETLTIGPAAPYQSEIIIDFDDLERWQKREMQRHFTESRLHASPFRRWIGIPLSNAALPMIWNTDADVAQIINWSRHALLVLALAIAFLQWPTAALGVLILVLLLEEVDWHHTALSNRNLDNAFMARAYPLLWAIFPVVALLSAAVSGQIDALLLGLLVSLSLAIGEWTDSTQADQKIMRDEAVVIGFVMLAVGVSLTTTALFIATAALVSGFWRPLSSRLKPI